MAADYLPEGFAIYQMRAEYKRQALLGDVFYPAVKVEEKNVTVALSAEDGKPYAIVELPEKKMSSPNNRISLLQWIREVNALEEKEVNVLGNALCSEYCATLIMESVVKYFRDGIEHIEAIPLHPASILIKREECLKPKDWDSWLSPQKK